jgi:hypothetical protein
VVCAGPLASKPQISTVSPNSASSPLPTRRRGPSAAPDRARPGGVVGREERCGSLGCIRVSPSGRGPAVNGRSAESDGGRRAPLTGGTGAPTRALAVGGPGACGRGRMGGRTSQDGERDSAVTSTNTSACSDCRRDRRHKIDSAPRSANRLC